MKKYFVSVAMLCAAVGLATARLAPNQGAAAAPSAQAAAQVKNPVSTVLRTMLPQRQKNILAAIEAMPADKFGYKPTPDQMSFAHLVIHITESNNGMCAKIADVAPPKVAELKETDSKDTLLAAARASFDYCGTSLASLDDSKFGDTVDFGRFQGPRVTAAFYLTGGWSDHYGAAAMYLRLNGILPPTAQPKK